MAKHDQSWSGARRGLAVLLLVAAVAGAGLRAVTPATALGPCPSDVDVCLIVNTSEDSDARDGVLTLREALRLAQGSLTLDDLSDGEWGQVVITMPPGWGPTDVDQPLTPPGFGGPGGIGSVAVSFDGEVFCASCPSRRILLLPDGAASTGNAGVMTLAGQSAALPVLAPPAGPPASQAAWRLRIGDLPTPGAGGSALPVIIDGGQLSPSSLGLAIDGPGVTLRGISFQHFSGPAVTLSCAAANDVNLNLHFADNGTDVATLGCAPEAP